MKFCEDCKHIILFQSNDEYAQLRYATCGKFLNKGIPGRTVSKKLVGNQFCDSAREFLFGPCGYFAGSFEPKEKS